MGERSEPISICGCAASEASKLRQGFGGAAPNGVQGRSPWPGARGRSPPVNFSEIDCSRRFLAMKKHGRM